MHNLFPATLLIMRFFCCFARTTIASLTHLIDYPHFHFFPRDVSNCGGSSNIRAHYFVRQLITFWLVQPIWHSRWTMCRKGQKLLVQITLFTIWQAWRVPLLSFHFFLKNLPLLFTPGAYVSRLQINKFYFYRMTFTTTYYYYYLLYYYFDETIVSRSRYLFGAVA